MNQKNKQNIIILGGGSAGWMSANFLRHHLPSELVDITLIESPEIGIIGVGEGSTPHLKKFFDMLGVSESDWMPSCSATYKTGISFIDWTSHQSKNRYFHPFPSPVDQQTAGLFLVNCIMRHKGAAVPCNPDDFFLSKKLAEDGLSPITAPPGKIALNYAYHFDSAKLGEYLRSLAVQNNVKWIQAKVINVGQHPSGDISHLLLDNGHSITGNFFVDASGFQSVLLQQTLGVGFEKFDSNLFADRAVALPTKLEETFPLAETQATALSHGWMWRIPLTNRFGNGYVYSSNYLSADEAEVELRQTLGVSEEVSAKHLSMNVGKVNHYWKNNVVAVGLSQGFIEPLEATALHLVLDTLGAFVQCYQQGNYNSAQVQAFNQHIDARYEGIRDYIVAHYKMNTRVDSSYWEDNRNNNNLSARLDAVLAAWKMGKDITPVLQEANMLSHYPAVSWYCLLAGYGAFPECTGHTEYSPQFTRMKTFIAQYAAKFQTHAASLHDRR